MSNHGHGRAAAFVVAAAVFLAACGGGSTADETGATNTDDVAFDEEATLTVAYNTGVESMDPLKQTSGPNSLYLQLFYDRLVHSEPDGTLVPGLATEWEWVDDTTLRLALREGVTFHDGTPFDSEAVKANVERTKAYTAGETLATAALADVTTVEVVDERTVDLVVGAPAPDLPGDLAEAGGMMISPAAIDGANLDLEAVGAGMFTFDEFSPGDRVVGSRYADYWDPDAVKVATIEIRQIADADTRMNALRSGQIDMTFVEPRQVADGEAAGLNLTAADSLAVFGLLSNTTQEPMTDPVVRRALSQAIDREVIAEELFFGYADPTLQMFPPDYYAYDPDHDLDYLPYDPEQARADLEDAGLDGVTVDVLVLNRPQDLQMSEVIQQMAAEAGITLELHVVEPAQFNQSFTADGPVQLFLGRWGGRGDPLQTLEALMGADGSLNPGGGTSEELTALMEEIDTLPIEDPAREDVVREASGVATEEMLEIPLVAVQVPWFTTDCVEGFQPYLNIRDEFRGVGLRSGC